MRHAKAQSFYALEVLPIVCCALLAVHCWLCGLNAQSAGMEDGHWMREQVENLLLQMPTKQTVDKFFGGQGSTIE